VVERNQIRNSFSSSSNQLGKMQLLWKLLSPDSDRQALFLSIEMPYQWKYLSLAKLQNESQAVTVAEVVTDAQPGTSVSDTTPSNEAVTATEWLLISRRVCQLLAL